MKQGKFSIHQESIFSNVNFYFTTLHKFAKCRSQVSDMVSHFSTS